MTFSIDLANQESTAAISDLFKNVISDLPYYNDLAKDSELKKYTTDELNLKILADPYSIIIAHEDAEIIGFCLSRYDDSLIWIEWFVVATHARRQGTARKLVRFLESTAVKRNAHKIWCDCRTENEKSINLLISLGYDQLCSVKNHWYGQDFILWQKEII